jgi:formylglycine-generating enzyme required for sulfatase activity
MSRLLRVLRGGSWNSVNLDNLRACGRDRNYPSFWDFNYGFRCVRGVMARDRRTVRGVSWVDDYQDLLRASGSSRFLPSLRDYDVGFRCVRGRSE